MRRTKKGRFEDEQTTVDGMQSVFHGTMSALVNSGIELEAIKLTFTSRCGCAESLTCVLCSGRIASALVKDRMEKIA